MVAPPTPTGPRRAGSTPRDLTAGVKAEALERRRIMLIDLMVMVLIEVDLIKYM